MNKSLIALRIAKAIAMLEKHQPMSDSEVQRCLGEIPDIFKAEDKRPPKDWWDSCIARAKGFADDPNKFCGALWYDSESRMEKAGKPWTKEQWESMKEAFGKAQLSDDFMEKCRELAKTVARSKTFEETVPEKIGKAFIDLLCKAVAEPIGSKFSPQQRKPKDFGGESEISSVGAKLNTADLEPSEKIVTS